MRSTDIFVPALRESFESYMTAFFKVAKQVGMTLSFAEIIEQMTYVISRPTNEEFAKTITSMCVADGGASWSGWVLRRQPYTMDITSVRADAARILSLVRDASSFFNMTVPLQHIASNMLRVFGMNDDELLEWYTRDADDDLWSAEFKRAFFDTFVTSPPLSPVPSMSNTMFTADSASSVMHFSSM